MRRETNRDHNVTAYSVRDGVSSSVRPRLSSVQLSLVSFRADTVRSSLDSQRPSWFSPESTTSPVPSAGRGSVLHDGKRVTVKNTVT